MNIKELREKTKKELNTLLNSQRERLRELRFKVASKQLKNVREIREIKKTIARILTLLKKENSAKKKQQAKVKKTEVSKDETSVNNSEEKK